jgi:hypothetical protein
VKDDDDYRTAFRVEVDESILLELAVWIRRRAELGRVHLKDLGDPKMIQGRPPFPRVEDISSTGVCFSYASSHEAPVEKFAGLVLLVYLKLVDPTDMMGEPLSFLAGFEVKHAQYHNGRNYLGLKLRWDGVPDQNEKAIFFADASRYGIADLTKWCDDMNRKICGVEHMPPQGLRLDRLLRELEVVKNPQQAAAHSFDKP